MSTLRLTEQGETISQKYANKVNAVYNMELLTASVTAKVAEDDKSGFKPHELEDVLEFMAVESKKRYEELMQLISSIDAIC